MFHFDHPNRRSVQENLQQLRNEKNRYLNQYSSNKMADYYDPNQNKYHKLDGMPQSQSISSSATNINNSTNHSQAQLHSYHHSYQLQQQHMNDCYSTGNGNLNGTNNNNCNTNGNGLSSAVLHPALLNIMNDAQAMKFRGIEYIDFDF